MIKVIRKINMEELVTQPPTTISSTEVPYRVITIGDQESIVFLTSIKPATKITYSKTGMPRAEIEVGDGSWAATEIVDLGTQYDHRVSFLQFNLDELDWNMMSGNKKYNNYSFYLVITDPNGESSTWEFDGETFEIPRKITKTAGIHSFTLVIEEYTKDAYVGNIQQEAPYFTERFVAKSFKGNVSPTGYSPEYDVTLFDLETNQLAALTKPSIHCTLADNGVLTLSNNVLGEKLDNFITYFTFKPADITAHLKSFTLFISFKQGDRFCASLFEKTDPGDYRDITTYPLVAWVPSEVYQNPGDWTVSVIGFMGRQDHINNPNEFNGDYYFYVSKETTVHVSDSIIQQSDLEKEAIVSVTLNLMTQQSEGILGADDSYYVLGGEDND